MSEIVTQLKALKLNGMTNSYAELISEGRNASMQISEWLVKHLIEAETTDREVRSIGYQMAAARFPIHRSLADFDFDFAQSEVDETLIKQLVTFDRTDAAQNIVLVGGTGTGKTHLATGLGLRRLNNMACERGSTPQWTWPICWNRRRLGGNKAGWR